MKPVSIQRWDHIGGGVGAWAYESDTGPMVTYADHVTAMEALNDEHLSEMLRVIEVHRDALRQAVESARIEWGMSNGPAFDYARGQRDALAAAVQRVAEEQQRVGDINFCKDCADWAIAAIKETANE